MNREGKCWFEIKVKLNLNVVSSFQDDCTVSFPVGNSHNEIVRAPTKIISRFHLIVYLNSMSKFNPEYSKVLRWLPHKVVSRGLLVVEPW